MIPQRTLMALIGVFLMAACDSEEVAKAPDPHEPTQNATGYYCNMTVVEHNGPKGHIFLAGDEIPLWFTSVRDTVAFTMLPEESKSIAVVYVNDMAKAKSWDQPEPGSWINAKNAIYVIGSSRVGGMGAPEPVPFSDPDKAKEFAAAFGGEIVAFADIPEGFILGDPNENRDDDTEKPMVDNPSHLQSGPTKGVNQ